MIADPFGSDDEFNEYIKKQKRKQRNFLLILLALIALAVLSSKFGA